MLFYLAIPFFLRTFALETKPFVMTYLNDFHRITTEQCLKELATFKTLQLDSEAEARHIQQMHHEIAARYPGER